MRIVTIKDETRDVVIGDRIELANTSLKRMVGLLGRRHLDAGAGLLIKPSSGVHTLGMSFTIDVIGVDKNMKVVELWNDLVPLRVTKVNWTMRSAIELPAGRIRECGVQLGDQLQISGNVS
jgi:uncharacterized membrane protein (UPF0127 family)